MFAKKQSDLLLFPGLQRRGQSAVRTARPLQHRRQALQHYLDNLWIIAVECHSQKIVPIIGPRFCMEIGSAHEKQPEHLEIAVHRCGHQRCKTVRIGKINRCTGVNEPARRFPILLRRCDQQRRAALRIASVWIDVFD